jgi:hypothetical protein
MFFAFKLKGAGRSLFFHSPIDLIFFAGDYKQTTQQRKEMPFHNTSLHKLSESLDSLPPSQTIDL